MASRAQARPPERVNRRFLPHPWSVRISTQEACQEESAPALTILIESVPRTPRRESAVARHARHGRRRPSRESEDGAWALVCQARGCPCVRLPGQALGLHDGQGVERRGALDEQRGRGLGNHYDNGGQLGQHRDPPRPSVPDNGQAPPPGGGSAVARPQIKCQGSSPRSVLFAIFESDTAPRGACAQPLTQLMFTGERQP